MPTDMSSAAHDLITGFVSGRLSYDRLSKDLREGARQSLEALQATRQTIRDFVEEGRLPPDLGQILLGQLPATDDGAAAHRGPASPMTSADATKPLATPASGAAGAEEFDEPTLPHAVTAAFPGDPGDPPVSDPAALRPDASAQSVKLPPLPFLDHPATEAGDDTRSKVDDAILSSLVSGYTDFRSRRTDAVPDGAASGDSDSGKLDKFLTDFRSARFRSDARRVSSGGQKDGLDLNSLTAAQHKRAGVGSILRDRFILDSEIGRGGMGYVYSAVDRRRLEAGHDQPYVAVKLLNESFHNDSEALRLLEAEARKSQALAHPNITTVYDFDRDKADVFIVMELLKGSGLDRRLGQAMGQPLPPGECARILKGTCAGLAHAHSRGVVHSDLKPGNIFQLEDGTIKLLDFGLAAAASASSDHPIQDSLTAAYASPEQFRRAERDPRDDIFALGCIAYQLLTGRHPFLSRPIDEVAREGVAAEPIEGLDPQGWETVRKALDFDREQRLDTVDGFLAGLFEDQD
ncbi:protein kinase [Roseibium sp. AS2]|uniref:serine/threonine-protein kinase n=1 Tax=Roseibium sp. AS2 TaxID=3135781 RepID=UPI0031810FC2